MVHKLGQVITGVVGGRACDMKSLLLNVKKRLKKKKNWGDGGQNIFWDIFKILWQFQVMFLWQNQAIQNIFPTLFLSLIRWFCGTPDQKKIGPKEKF